MILRESKVNVKKTLNVFGGGRKFVFFGYGCFVEARLYHVTHRPSPCAAIGGEGRSQLVGGDVTAVDLERLDPGAQYEVQVMALVENREGNPVSVRVTTRESCLHNIKQCYRVHV